MNPSTLRTIVLLLMLGSGIMCKQVVTPTLTGKLVINRACSHYVIQVLQGSIDPSKIDAQWQNPANDSVYINVFSVANRCTFPNIAEGDTISFQLDPSAPADNCSVCDIAYPTPPVSNAVQNVQKRE